MAAIRPNPTLSEDLISEILVRVPVKSLICFQSVCKAWLSLIKHPAFVKSQLRHAITVETDQTLIINRCKGVESECSSEQEIVLLDVDSREIVADLRLPYSRGECNIRIVGSANGIVCFVDAVDFPKHETSIYLWNPAIRQSKLIPSYSDERLMGTWGFGYDPIDHDFKVVSIISPPFMSAHVYSANKNVWQKLSDPVDVRWNRDFDVCVKGFMCGFGTYGMMTFDLNKETLNSGIKLPAIFDDDEARITEFNNSVAVIISRNELDVYKTDWRLDQKIYVWMLDDDTCLSGGGVEASWTPMFSIDLVTPSVVILGYFNKRDLLLLISSDDYVWISCNSDRKEVKAVPLSVDMASHHYTRDGYKYRETLVSLAGFKQVN
ncbi:F-box protein CPR1-like [Apium graveolens]|uniref:F-box protein CPR1-like n=1 Tax=Apium graveolens TaxID=4045 RepID=UPI003D799270